VSNSLNDIKALSEKYLDVLMEENTKTTATVDVKLDGNKLDVMISNITSQMHLKSSGESRSMDLPFRLRLAVITFHILCLFLLVLKQQTLL
jgi:hypothetical protein